MPAGVQVTRSKTLDLDYRCESCGYRALAVLRASGSAKSYRAGIIDDHYEDLASSDAEHALLNDAQSQLGLLPCPRCKKRNAAEVGIFRIKAFFRLLGNAAVGLCTYAITTLGKWTSGETAIAMAIVGGLTLLNLGSLYSRWFRADKRVALLPKPKPRQPGGAG